MAAIDCSKLQCKALVGDLNLNISIGTIPLIMGQTILSLSISNILFILKLHCLTCHLNISFRTGMKQVNFSELSKT